MNKTLTAIDDLVSSVIMLIPTWLSMLKSTRVLTMIATGAIIYLTATQGGLTDWQTMAAQAIEAALGISFIGFKTIRSDSTIGGSPPVPPTTEVIKVEKKTPPSPQSQDFNATGHPEEPPPPPQPGVVFNETEFDALVEDKAKREYLEANDITRYFAAQDLGDGTRWASLYHQMAFQDYLVAKTFKAFEAKFGYPYQEAEKHLADDKKCPYYSVDNMARQKGVDFWFMLRMVRQTIAKAQELGTT